MPPSTEHPQGEGGRDGPTQEEVDRRFAELVSDPDLGDLQFPGPSVTEPPPDRVPRDREHIEGPDAMPSPPATPETLGGPRDYAPPDEPDEPFQPPEPQPLGTADPIKLVAWTAAIAAPIALILVVLLWPSAPPIVWLTLIAIALVGWGVAFARLPRSRDDDDDGAVV